MTAGSLCNSSAPPLQLQCSPKTAITSYALCRCDTCHLDYFKRAIKYPRVNNEPSLKYDDEREIGWRGR